MDGCVSAHFADRSSRSAGVGKVLLAKLHNSVWDEAQLGPTVRHADNGCPTNRRVDMQLSRLTALQLAGLKPFLTAECVILV